MARPTKLTPALQDELCTHLRNGNFLETACALAGIAPATAYNWLALGRGESVTVHTPTGPKVLKATPAHAAFLEAVTRAGAEAENRMVMTLMAGARFGEGVHQVDAPGGKTVTVRVGDARHASEFLRRRYPERWNRSVKDVQQTTTARVVTIDGGTSADRVADIAARVAANPAALDKAHELMELLNGSSAGDSPK